VVNGRQDVVTKTMNLEEVMEDLIEFRTGDLHADSLIIIAEKL
jgi:hypothetical protein